jgi:multidrug efflux pump subunit AcrA (membrane-fusion protein)
MTANVVVPTPPSPGVVLLPSTAIYRDGDAPAVWIYDPRTQQVALRAVTIARYREDGVLVRDGVRHGEWVVAAGVHKLAQGQKVRPYEGGEAARVEPTSSLARSR